MKYNVLYTCAVHAYLYSVWEGDHQPLAHLLAEGKQIPPMPPQRWELRLTAYQYIQFATKLVGHLAMLMP